jgi:hypothetical protein
VRVDQGTIALHKRRSRHRLALVPRPRRHLVTYHGVLTPNASLRHRVVPRVAEDGEEAALDEDCADPEEARSDEVAAGSVVQQVARVPHRPGKLRRGMRRYYTWAELLRRVFRVEIFTCPNCGGVRRQLAAIQDPDSIERVLRAMGLSFDAPGLAVAGFGWFEPHFELPVRLRKHRAPNWSSRHNSVNRLQPAPLP